MEKPDLRGIEIFQDLSEKEMFPLMSICCIKEVAAGTIIYEPEQPSEEMFLIKKGRVGLYHLSAEGKIFTTAILETGSFFGITMFGSQNCDTYAETFTECAIYLISRQHVETVLLADRRVAFRIAESLCKRLSEAEGHLADLILKNVPARVVSLLLKYAHQNDSAEVRLTHEELAQMLGIRRETVTRILHDLQNRQLILQRRGRVVLLDTNGLKKISAE